MSYTRIWCLRSESNQRHADFQSAALPTELQRHIVESLSSPQMHYMATPNGLEPSTSSVTGWRANRLHHRAKFGGNNRARTYDLLLVRQMLSQLSYAPIRLPATCILYHKVLGLSIPFFKIFLFFFSFLFLPFFKPFWALLDPFFSLFSSKIKFPLHLSLKALYKTGADMV